MTKPQLLPFTRRALRPWKDPLRTLQEAVAS